jgi:hypothetical protein
MGLGLTRCVLGNVLFPAITDFGLAVVIEILSLLSGSV